MRFLTAIRVSAPTPHRLEGVIVFNKKAEADDHLNKWGGDINKLLGLVERSCHLIARHVAPPHHILA